MSIVLSIICSLIAVQAIPIADPQIYGSEWQGDIKLTAWQRNAIEGRITRTGATWLSARWPKNAFGEVIVPYRFASNSGFSKH